MLAIFCLRLAAGLVACLLLLSPAQVNPRFFRTHFLTALGLTAVAAVFLRQAGDAWLWIVLTGAMVLCALGSMTWMLEGAPGGRVLIVLTSPLLLTGLALAGYQARDLGEPWWLLLDDCTSAAVLGSAMTAMLMGHSYLLAPAMSLTPLLRLLAALAATTVLRIGVTAGGLWLWTGTPAGSTLDSELILWLAVRWGIGFVGPLVLAWLAWEATRIRSTQSATGILYVVVILCFLGELTSQLLLARTDYTL
jgi:hypothetical protein